MERSLDNLLNWENDWQMLFNLSESKAIHIGKGNPNFQKSTDGVSRDQVKEEREFFTSFKQCNIAAARASGAVG